MNETNETERLADLFATIRRHVKDAGARARIMAACLAYDSTEGASYAAAILREKSVHCRSQKALIVACRAVLVPEVHA